MARFNTGQEVVCVANGRWKEHRYGRKLTGPKKNELVTVAGYKVAGFVYLKEYPILVGDTLAGFDEKFFEPVVPSETIEELMESLETEIRG